MGWVDQTFVSCQTLTASQMQGLQDDFAALAGQISGAPLVTFPNSTLVASAGLITDVGCGGLWHADSGFSAPEVSSFGSIEVSSEITVPGFAAPEVGSFGTIDAASGFQTTEVGSLGMLDVSSELTIHGAAASPPAANTLYKDNQLNARINFDGTGTISIRDSFNVDSITDNGTGDYTVTWDTDFADADYSMITDTRLEFGASHLTSGFHTQAAGSVDVQTYNENSNALIDSTIVTAMASGDQS